MKALDPTQKTSPGPTHPGKVLENAGISVVTSGQLDFFSTYAYALA